MPRIDQASDASNAASLSAFDMAACRRRAGGRRRGGALPAVSVVIAEPLAGAEFLAALDPLGCVEGGRGAGLAYMQAAGAMRLDGRNP